jgi:hypothetical protein
MVTGRRETLFRVAPYILYICYSILYEKACRKAAGVGETISNPKLSAMLHYEPIAFFAHRVDEFSPGDFAPRAFRISWMLTRKAASTTLAPGQSATMISSLVTKRRGFRTTKPSTPKVLDLDAQEGLVRHVEDEGLKRSRVPRPICPRWVRGMEIPPQILQKFYDRTIATNDPSVSMIATLDEETGISRRDLRRGATWHTSGAY